MIDGLLTEHFLEFQKLKGRLQRLVRVYAGQNATLLEISCHDSIITFGFMMSCYVLSKAPRMLLLT